jgi:hypothetical protein
MGARCVSRDVQRFQAMLANTSGIFAMDGLAITVMLLQAAALGSCRIAGW